MRVGEVELGSGAPARSPRIAAEGGGCGQLGLGQTGGRVGVYSRLGSRASREGSKTLQLLAGRDSPTAGQRGELSAR